MSTKKSDFNPGKLIDLIVHHGSPNWKQQIYEELMLVLNALYDGMKSLGEDIETQLNISTDIIHKLNSLHPCIKSYTEYSHVKRRRYRGKHPPVGTNLLHAACFIGMESLVVDLIALGAEPNLPNEAGETPITIAIRRGHLTVVKTLLSGKISIRCSHGSNIQFRRQLLRSRCTEIEFKIIRPDNILRHISYANPCFTLLIDSGFNLYGDLTETRGPFNVIGYAIEQGASQKVLAKLIDTIRKPCYRDLITEVDSMLIKAISKNKKLHAFSNRYIRPIISDSKDLDDVYRCIVPLKFYCDIAHFTLFLERYMDKHKRNVIKWDTIRLFVKIRCAHLWHDSKSSVLLMIPNEIIFHIVSFIDCRF
jgi:hypothetical protein